MLVHLYARALEMNIFDYTSCMMNCVFDCEYCYLKGMYPSGNVVLFVNLDDIFDEVYKLLQKHPCISLRFI